MDNPLEETFSREHMTKDTVGKEIERVKKQIIDLQPESDIRFYTDYAGFAIMEIRHPNQIMKLQREEFEKGSETKRLLRKLEDLAYASEHGEFSSEVPKRTLVDSEPAERQINTKNSEEYI